MRAGRGGGGDGVGAAATTYSAGAGLDLTGTIFSIAAIAANTIFANPTGSAAVPVGLELTANTFAARSSAGNIAAKPITDFALSLVDDVDAPAARTTLGITSIATLPNGSDAGNLVWWNGSAWAETSTFETDGARIYFGGAPSAGGEINVSNNVFVASGKRSNAVDAALVVWDVNDDLTFGSPDIDNARYDAGTGFSHLWHVNSALRMSLSNSTATIGANNAAFTSVVHTMGTGGAVTVLVAGATEYTINATEIVFNQNGAAGLGYASFGTTPAGAGALRFSVGSDIRFFDGGNTLIVANFAANTINFGANDAALTTLRSRVGTGGSFLFEIAGSPEYTANATTLDGGGNTLTNWASLALSSFIALGADPADSGAVRLSNGTGNGVSFEASPAGTDVQAMFLDASEVLQVYDSEWGFNATTLACNQNSITNAIYGEFGTGTFAAGGDIRFANGGNISLWNGANTIRLLHGSGNTINIGNNDAAIQTINLALGSGGSAVVQIAGATEFTLNATRMIVASGNDITFAGGAPSSTVARLNFPTNNVLLGMRNAANDNDVIILKGASGSNRIDLGDSATGTPIAMLVFDVASGGSYNWEVNDGTVAILNTTALDLRSINLTWINTHSTPTIQQTIDTTATENTVRTTLLAAQDKSGNTSTTAGTTRVRGGNATGAGGTHNGGVLENFGGDATGASGTRNGGNNINRAGTGATQDGSWHVLSNATSVLEIARMANARRVTALNRGALLTTTQMPTNTGDLVTYVGNAATDPTAAPVSGAVLYGSSGALRGMNTGKLVESVTAQNGGSTFGTFKATLRRENHVSTSNATQTVIDTLTLTNGSVNGIQATVHARKDGTDQAVYFLRAAVIQEGGTAALIGAVDALVREDQAGWDATVTVSGSAVRVSVTGAAATNIDWWVYWEITSWQP